MSVDLNRGCTAKTHPDGGLVYMYKDDPGTYFTSSSDPVTDERAREAGFPVALHRIEKKKRKLIEDARREIEARVAKETALEMERIEREADLVARGESPAMAATAVAASDPFGENEVRKNSTGRPRETSRRKMVFKGPQNGWDVIDKASGKVLIDSVSAEDAEIVLLEQA